jgi:hypothetical protein
VGFDVHGIASNRLAVPDSECHHALAEFATTWVDNVVWNSPSLFYLPETMFVPLTPFLRRLVGFACFSLLCQPAVFAATAGNTDKPVATRSLAANRVAEVPDYAHSLAADTGWLDFGLESRTRYEMRDHDYTRGLMHDHALVTRNLLYLGIKEVTDPLRLAFELQDSRSFFSACLPRPKCGTRWSRCRPMRSCISTTRSVTHR